MELWARLAVLQFWHCPLMLSLFPKLISQPICLNLWMVPFLESGPSGALLPKPGSAFLFAMLSFGRFAPFSGRLIRRVIDTSLRDGYLVFRCIWAMEKKQLLCYVIYGHSGARWSSQLKKRTHNIVEAVLSDAASRGCVAYPRFLVVILIWRFPTLTCCNGCRNLDGPV